MAFSSSPWPNPRIVRRTRASPEIRTGLPAAPRPRLRRRRASSVYTGRGLKRISAVDEIGASDARLERDPAAAVLASPNVPVEIAVGVTARFAGIVASKAPVAATTRGTCGGGRCPGFSARNPAQRSALLNGTAERDTAYVPLCAGCGGRSGSRNVRAAVRRGRTGGTSGGGVTVAGARYGEAIGVTRAKPMRGGAGTRIVNNRIAKA